jgi:hygromycin-B 7''-O-kinase
MWRHSTRPLAGSGPISTALARCDATREDAVIGDEEILRPAVTALVARHGLADREIRRYPDGSEPVYAVGEEHVVKLYPTAAADDEVTEAHVLEFLQGRLPVPTPELIAHGEYESGWRFILMSQLPGADLSKTWEQVPEHGRDRIADEVGGMLAALHALDSTPLTGLTGPKSWSAFLADQSTKAVEQQRERKLPELWTEQIPDFLADLVADRPLRFRASHARRPGL